MPRLYSLGNAPSKNCTVWEHSLSGQVWAKCPTRPDTQGTHVEAALMNPCLRSVSCGGLFGSRCSVGGKTALKAVMSARTQYVVSRSLRCERRGYTSAGVASVLRKKRLRKMLEQAGGQQKQDWEEQRTKPAAGAVPQMWWSHYFAACTTFMFLCASVGLSFFRYHWNLC